MTPPNMQLPPPCVSGIAIPANMIVKSSAYDNYMESQERMRAAEERIKDRRKMSSPRVANPYSVQNPSESSLVSSILKISAGVGVAVGAFFGIKSLVKHFKK